MGKAKEGVSLTPTRKIFYGWWIVAVGCVVWMFNGMTTGYGMSVFYKRLLDDFGWTRAQLAGAISMARLESGLLGPIGGFLVDKLGPTRVMLVGVSLMSLGLVLLSGIDTLTQFYLIYIGLVIIGNSISYLIPIDTTVANWFIKKRGLAFGYLRGAIAIGAAAVPLLSWFITQYGWRAAFVASGIGTLALGIPAAFVMKSRPERYGMLPDGEEPPERDDHAEATVAIPAVSGAAAVVTATAPVTAEEAGEDDIGMTPVQALKSSAFWIISMGFGLRLMVTGAVTLHAVPLVEDLGYSKGTAAAILGTIGSVSLVGRIPGGRLCDVFGTKRVTVISALTLAVASLLLAFAHNLWQVILFVAIYAPSYGAQVAAMPAMTAAYYGRRAYGTIVGFAALAQTAGSVAGPYFAAATFDATGSYKTAFLVFTLLLLVAAGLFSLLRRPRYV